VTSTDIRSQRAALVAEAKQIYQRAREEGREELQSEEKEKWDKIMGDVDSLRVKAEAAERGEKLERLDAELAAPVARKTSPASPAGKRDLDRQTANEMFRSWALASQPGMRPSAETAMRAAEYGFDVNSQEIAYTRALSKGSTSAGGYTVPVSFSTEIEKLLAYYWPVQEAVTSFQTDDGRDLQWPTVDDTSNSSGIVSEASGIGSSSDPSFGQVTFKSFDYYSPIVKVSNQLIRDSQQDIAALLAELFAERMGRALDAAIVSTNAGSSAPEGMLYGVSAGVNLDSGNGITVAKLVALETSVPLAYRGLPGVRFMMHDATWQAIRSLEDDEGRLLFGGSIQDGVAKRLLGYPVSITNSMTSINSPGDNQPLILFGATNKYRLRRIAGSTLTRLNELYAANGQVGFVLHEAYDGRWLTKSGVKTLNSYDAP
jgi:HK97 family phage major capsid protein